MNDLVTNAIATLAILATNKVINIKVNKVCTAVNMTLKTSITSYLSRVKVVQMCQAAITLITIRTINSNCNIITMVVTITTIIVVIMSHHVKITSETIIVSNKTDAITIRRLMIRVRIGTTTVGTHKSNTFSTNMGVNTVRHNPFKNIHRLISRHTIKSKFEFF